jgi:hypothetical protein
VLELHPSIENDYGYLIWNQRLWIVINPILSVLWMVDFAPSKRLLLLVCELCCMVSPSSHGHRITTHL